MQTLHFSCRSCGKSIDTGVDRTAEAMAREWQHSFTLACPRCGSAQEITVREAYQSSVATGPANDRSPARLKQAVGA